MESLPSLHGSGRDVVRDCECAAPEEPSIARLSTPPTGLLEVHRALPGVNAGKGGSAQASRCLAG